MNKLLYTGLFICFYSHAMNGMRSLNSLLIEISLETSQSQGAQAQDSQIGNSNNCAKIEVTCFVCGAKFLKENLEFHIFLHTKKTIYCEKCNEPFDNEYILWAHHYFNICANRPKLSS